mmetsp:Transcript_17890/g.49560  ORF Transcript_17890/g.49560 Transcript_17890/m.49560 type:complete len:80 (-) Transcript_17890:1588-1827(-)
MFRANSMLSGDYVSVDLSAHSEKKKKDALDPSATIEQSAASIAEAKGVVECAALRFHRPGGPFFVVTDDLAITRALQSH